MVTSFPFDADSQRALPMRGIWGRWFGYFKLAKHGNTEMVKIQLECDVERRKVGDFLINLGLTDYYSAFIEHNFDSRDALTDIEMGHLIKMK